MNAILMNAAANQQPQGPLPATWAGSPAASWADRAEGRWHGHRML
jgi:hypothetical protein